MNTVTPLLKRLILSLLPLVFSLISVPIWGLCTVQAQPVEQVFQGISFIQVQGADTQFGSPLDQQGRRDNELQRWVSLDHTFWISKYEVSQGEWISVMGSNPSTFRQLGPDLSAPVETITWHQAKEFVAKLNQAAGGAHFRLPTEAEWEFVAKAGTQTMWSFGDDQGLLAQYTHREGGEYPRSHGLKTSNSLGIYDLYGNVYEWCEDWYKAYPKRGACGPSEGTYKVIRGGSNGASVPWLRSSSRNFAHPDRRGYYIGLRLVYVSDPAADLFKSSEDCTPTPTCGDGIVNGAETCDDGGRVAGDGCSATCTLEGEEGEVAAVCLIDNGGCGPADLIECSGDGSGGALCTPKIGVHHYPLPQDSVATTQHRVLIIMVNTTGEIPERTDPTPAGLQEHYTAEELGETYFRADHGVRSFVYDASYHRVDLSGSVVGWFHTEPEELSDVDMMQRREEYFELACHLVDCSDYDIFVLNGRVTGQGTNIGWTKQNSLNVAQGSFQNVGFDFMINSPFLVHGDTYSDGLLLPNASWPHELMHTLGVSGHANSLWCSEGETEVILSGTCDNKAYGGVFSLMGERAFATHPDFVQKTAAGWMGAGEVHTLDVTGSFTSAKRVIYPLSSQEAGAKGLSVRLPRPVTVSGLDLDRIHFEYRAPIGLDHYLTRLDGPSAPDGGSFLQRYTSLQNIDRVGAHVFLDIEYSGGNSTWTIDTHPGTAYNPDRGIKWQGNPGRFADAILNVGETLSTSTLLDIEIEVLQTTVDGGLEVEVRCIGDHCNQGVCGENEHVVSGECVFCPAGMANVAGDDPSGGDTDCEVLACPPLSHGDNLPSGCLCRFIDGVKGQITAQRYSPGYTGGCEPL